MDLVVVETTTAEVASAVGADARGLELLLNAASALRLLEKREGGLPMWIERECNA